MRDYIRHPSDIPIEFETIDATDSVSYQLNNISEGGLSFNSPYALECGSIVRLNFPLRSIDTEIRAEVKWCREIDAYYEIGVQFHDVEDIFRVRMVEQVCHIEHYKRRVWNEEGRDISPKQAAIEWIEKYASDFPH